MELVQLYGYWSVTAVNVDLMWLVSVIQIVIVIQRVKVYLMAVSVEIEEARGLMRADSDLSGGEEGGIMVDFHISSVCVGDENGFRVGSID